MRLPAQKQVWYWGGALAVLLLALWALGNQMMPFILGAAVAYLLDPVADRLERLGLSRTLAVVVITLVGVLIMVAVVLMLVPVLVRQTTQLVNTAPQMAEQLQQFLMNRFPQVFAEGSTVNTALTNVGQRVSESGMQVVSTVLGSVMGVFSLLALVVIVPVVAFYLLLDWDSMVARLDELLPREHADTIRGLARDIDRALSGFVRGQGLVILILGTFYSVGLGLVGLPFGVAIGALAASLSFIPYVGVLIGGATAIGVALFSFWGEPVWIGAVVAIFAAGQFIEGNFLQPKIVGGSVGVHPVWLMLALTVFGTMFGFVGLLVAVPIAAALGVLVRYAVGRYKESALYTGREVPAPPAPPMLIELVPRGTVANLRRLAQLSHDVRVAEIQRQEELAELVEDRQDRARKQKEPRHAPEGPPSPVQLHIEARRADEEDRQREKQKKDG
ncbi:MULTISPECIES: AI-2E family transporter [Paracoccus]|uniref:AI-2E family transporter n=2 Tax=Paracoccus TaxID=265 RepID=A0A386ULR1_9RHOB|nr:MULTISPECIES: AI-2E family transporter [Paracoccus]AWX94185.1 AI-2E family transporter [Paracoccus mutanolyticus]AYF01060.1 AI-2E family transporter [Paracoccus yeei]MBY0137002.1 AI-2E family transporter [Paracoccus yeei]QEU08850.1 AI-2E family transporter [Paracoccus yeei]